MIVYSTLEKAFHGSSLTSLDELDVLRGYEAHQMAFEGPRLIEGNLTRTTGIHALCVKKKGKSWETRDLNTSSGRRTWRVSEFSSSACVCVCAKHIGHDARRKRSRSGLGTNSQRSRRQVHWRGSAECFATIKRTLCNWWGRQPATTRRVLGLVRGTLWNPLRTLAGSTFKNSLFCAFQFGSHRLVYGMISHQKLVYWCSR